jgi:metallo-beta-lactamase class B
MRVSLLSLALFATVAAHAQIEPAWVTPIAPFQIADDLYYVGSQDLASYLVVTPQGDILINSNLTSSPPLIRKSVEQLGFQWTDIKILLISHAHADHDSGSAQILRETGAKYMVMDGDVPVVESGGAADFDYPNSRYPAAHVDRVLHDGDEVRLGGVVLVAHKTAGHTRGCTTWTMKTTQHGQPRNVVIVGSWYWNDYRLVDGPGHPPRYRASYPGIAADFEHTFALLHTLPCDIFLGAHGSYFDMLAKLERAKAGAGESAWVDPDGYQAALAKQESDFRETLARRQAAGQ